jgi:hypothetical protein
MLTSRKHSSLFLLLSSVVVYFFLTGYQFAFPDGPLIIPGIYQIADPGHLTGSWSIAALLPYHYLFKWFYAQLMALLPLTALYLISYLGLLFVYMASIRDITVSLAGREEPFYYGLGMLVFWKLAGIDATRYLGVPEFGVSFAAYALATLALSAFLKERYFLMAVACGIAALIHASIGIDMFIVLITAYGFLKILLEKGKRWESVQTIFLPCVIFLCMALVAIVAEIAAGGLEKNGDNGFFLELIRFRGPHHLLLSSFRGSLVEFASIVIVGIASFICVKRSTVDRRTAAFSFAMLLGIITQFVFVEIIPSASLAKVGFYRMTIFMALLSLIYVCRFIDTLIVARKSDSILIPVFMLIFCRSAVLLPLVFLVIIRMAFGHRKKVLQAGLIITSMATFFGIYVVSGRTGSYVSEVFLLTRVTLMYLLFSAAATFLLVRLIRSLHEHPYRLVFVLCSALFIIPFSGQNRGDAFQFDLSPHSEWEEACLWVKGHTEEGTHFIIPPDQQGFVLFAEREMFVNFKEVPLTVAYGKEWKERLEMVTGCADIFALPEKGFRSLPVLLKGYNALSENTLFEIKKKYGTTHVIFEKPHALSLPVVYESQNYVIYKIEEPL